MGKIKIGIIGAGSISPYHLNGYKKLDNVELYAVCDIDKGRMEASKEKYSFKKGFLDYNEMFKDKNLDAVSVCTSNEAHAPVAIAALNAGLHVLSEKPMSLNGNQSEAMQEAADKAGKILMVGFVRRHGKDVKILKDFMAQDVLGEIYYAKATYLRRFGCPSGWFSVKERSGGGPMIDLGVHVVDMVRYLMGNPKPVSVCAATFNKLGARDNLKQAKSYVSSEGGDVFNVEDLATAMIRFDNGAVLYVDTSFSLNIKEPTGRVELFGTKAGAKIDSNLEIYSEMADHMVDITPTGNNVFDMEAFNDEIAHFVDCVANNVECISPGKDGVVVSKIVDAVYESARLGREVLL